MFGHSSMILFVAMLCIAGAFGKKCTPTATDVLGPMSSYKFPSKNAVCPSTSSDRIEISGRVLDEDCKPLSGIKLQVWQTDAKGVYTKDCRAELTTDSNGRYKFTSVKPGIYSFGGNTRPSHIHFQAFSNDKSALISQIYFKNSRPCDAWAGEACSVPASHIALSSGKGSFDIVLRKATLLAESNSLQETEFAVANGENVRDMVPLGDTEEKSTSTANWVLVAAGIYGSVGVVSMIVAVAFYIRSRRPNEGALYQEMVAGQAETI